MDNSLSGYISYAENTRMIIWAIGMCAALYIAIKKTIKQNSDNTVIASIIIAVIALYRLGSQPIGWITGGDRANYAYRVIHYDGGINFGNFQDYQDPLFTVVSDWIYKLCNSDIDTYFIVLAAIYVTLYLLACRRMVGKSQLWMLVAIMLSLGFIGYGYNTMRAGLAYATLLYGITFRDKPIKMAICMVIALGIHFSMVIPIAMFLIARFYPKTKTFFILWFLAIPISFMAGSFFNNFFSTFSEDRTHYLTSENENYNIGFRIDFIVYSLIPLIAGYYYIYKKNFESAFYKNLYNTYILANIFWILVIRSNFTDRFAYLSWFLFPVILVYPLIKQYNLVSSPNKWIALILLGEGTFMLMI